MSTIFKGSAFLISATHQLNQGKNAHITTIPDKTKSPFIYDTQKVYPYIFFYHMPDFFTLLLHISSVNTNHWHTSPQTTKQINLMFSTRQTIHSFNKHNRILFIFHIFRHTHNFQSHSSTSHLYQTSSRNIH